MKYAEMIAKIKAAMQQKRAAIGDIMQKAIGSGSTPTAEQDAEIKAIEAELTALELNLKRVEALQTAAGEAEGNADPVEGGSIDQGTKSAPPQGVPPVIETPLPVLDKGIGFALAIKCLFHAKGSGFGAVEVAKSLNLPAQVQKFLHDKAVIGTTSNADFAAPLVDNTNLTSEFLELLRPKTVLGRMTGFRNVPFNVSVPTQIGATQVAWVGEAAKKPATDAKFGKVTLGFAKVAGIVVMSQELMRFSNPAADGLVRDDMVKSVSEFLDQQFLDPTKTETVESPAGILNGTAAITPQGITAADYEADLEKLIAAFVAANLTTSGAYWVMSETRAMRLALLRDALGNRYFDGMALNGARTLLGLPVIESEAVGDIIALVQPQNILLADDGGVNVDYSDQATIDMGSESVNLYQQNLLAIRTERFIRWKPARRAVAWLNYAALPVEP